MLKQFFFSITLILLIVFGSNAQVPQLINYQGFLSDASGNPISGSRSIEFKIYNLATGGTALWSETHTITANEGWILLILLFQ